MSFIFHFATEGFAQSVSLGYGIFKRNSLGLSVAGIQSRPLLGRVPAIADSPPRPLGTEWPKRN